MEIQTQNKIEGYSELLITYVYDNIEILMFRRLSTRGRTIDGGYRLRHQYYLKVKKNLGDKLLIRSGRLTAPERFMVWSLITSRETLVQYCLDTTRKFRQRVIYLN